MADTTVITIVTDESGSMATLAGATIDGFNEYVTSLQSSLKDQSVYFSSILFDTRGIRTLQKGVAIKDAIKLSRENYVPTGGTPLLDAAAKAILATDEVMTKESGTKAIVVIQTDGEENSSQEISLAALKTLIEERQAKGWQFVFMGAGINAYASGSRMGFSAGNTMSYEATGKGTRSSYSAMVSNTQSYVGGQSTGMGFSSDQKMDAGDIYVSDLDLTKKPEDKKAKK